MRRSSQSVRETEGKSGSSKLRLVQGQSRWDAQITGDHHTPGFITSAMEGEGAEGREEPGLAGGTTL